MAIREQAAATAWSDEVNQSEANTTDTRDEYGASGEHQSADRVSTPPSGRQKRARGFTLSNRRVSKRELLELRKSAQPADPRPQTRAECMQGVLAVRPCPFVSCTHHLYLDVNENNGSIKLNFPGVEVWELPESCALDVADRGSLALEDIGVLMNLTRERIRQLEARGLARLKALNEIAALHDLDN